MYYVDQKRQSISFYTMHNFLLTRPLLIFLFLLFPSPSSSFFIPSSFYTSSFLYIYIYIFFFHPQIHRHHIDPRLNFFFNTASWIVELYTTTTTFLFPATITTTTFLLIVSLHNHHHHHIPTVFTSSIFLADRLFRRTDRPKAGQKAKKAKLK